MANLIYGKLQGAQKILDVYDDHLTLTQVKNFRSLLTNNWFQGEKEISFYDISSVQFKAGNSLILGYIQFEVPGVRSADNFNSENSWTFDSSLNDVAKQVCDYVRNRIRELKKPVTQQYVAQHQQLSPADQLLKMKQLLDAGIINQDEFNQKKKELLGL